MLTPPPHYKDPFGVSSPDRVKKAIAGTLGIDRGNLFLITSQIEPSTRRHGTIWVNPRYQQIAHLVFETTPVIPFNLSPLLEEEESFPRAGTFAQVMAIIVYELKTGAPEATGTFVAADEVIFDLYSSRGTGAPNDLYPPYGTINLERLQRLYQAVLQTQQVMALDRKVEDLKEELLEIFKIKAPSSQNRQETEAMCAQLLANRETTFVGDAIQKRISLGHGVADIVWRAWLLKNSLEPGTDISFWQPPA